MEKEVMGSETTVKVIKNKVAPPFKTAEFEIIYGEGVSKIGEIIDLGVKFEILEKSGSWYAFKGNKIGQGKENTKTYLKENPKIAGRLNISADTVEDPHVSRLIEGLPADQAEFCPCLNAK